MIPLYRLSPYDADIDLDSPNHGPRTGNPGIRLIVLHATADNGSELGAESWMRNPDAEVSAHLHIRRDGTVVRLVDDRRRAWHAGASSWPGVGDVNSESLGWEIANRNDGREAYTDAQYRAVAELLAHYLPQGIARGDVVSHAQVSPGRKTDPLGWDWARMWGLVDHLTSPVPPPVPRLENSVRNMPQPKTERVHPLRRPVREVVGQEETGEAFLRRLGGFLGPFARPLWDLLVSKVVERIEEKADEAFDRVFR